jgi:hypothetical protein
MKGEKLMINERTLRIWRQDSLKAKERLHSGLILEKENIHLWKDHCEINDRILRLTMELLDIRLMEKVRGNRK